MLTTLLNLNVAYRTQTRDTGFTDLFIMINNLFWYNVIVYFIYSNLLYCILLFYMYFIILMENPLILFHFKF